MTQPSEADTRRSTKRRIFVNVETVSHFGRDIIEGIIRFALENNWELGFESRTLAEPLPHWFRYWNGDGIISRSGSRKMLADLRAKNCPVVELTGTGPENEPEVAADRGRIAEMIFSHFFERGFREFAVYSYSDTWWSTLEKKCYVELLREHGFRCHTFRVPVRHAAIIPKWSEGDRVRLQNWLAGLPKPIAMYVVTDAQAVPLLQICRNLGIRVPDDLAVVSVENDEWLCNVTDPPLSSVDQNGKKIGWLAAELLRDRMNGHRLAHEQINVAPLYIQTRQSSDCVAIDNPELVDVIRYIREMACAGLTVREVVRYSNMSHATLGRLFHKWLGRTIEQEIRHVQIERAKLLLRETQCSIAAVASSVGFQSPEYFCFAFRQAVGLPPHEFRSTK
ncbi:MAG: DNA-binding transcriptional regulator [Planctomycetia bacterium]|nr:DNA-binding transcriptional regulator [Planctomycetia bacterium]